MKKQITSVGHGKNASGAHVDLALDGKNYQMPVNEAAYDACDDIFAYFHSIDIGSLMTESEAWEELKRIRNEI